MDCATDGTVSVSTVMLRKGGSMRDRLESEEMEGFDEMVPCCCDATRCSCVLPCLTALLPLSLPLSALLLFDLELRSSVTLEELTSFRSSSEPFCEDDAGTKLKTPLAKFALINGFPCRA